MREKRCFQAIHDDTFYGIQDNSAGNQSVFVKGTGHGTFWAFAKAIAEGNFESFSVFDDGPTLPRSNFVDPANTVRLIPIEGGGEIRTEESQYIRIHAINGKLIKVIVSTY